MQRRQVHIVSNIFYLVGNIYPDSIYDPQPDTYLPTYNLFINDLGLKSF